MRTIDPGSATQIGGITEQTQNTRSQFAETAVQQQVSLLGEFQQLQASLTPLQTAFDVSSSSAIPSALNQLFQSFSNWSTQPNDVTAQASVINAAQQTAAAFQQTAAQLATISSSTDATLRSTVSQINQDAAKIQAYNVAVSEQGGSNASLDSQLYSTLEDLSSLTDVQVIPGNGSQASRSCSAGKPR